MGELIFELWRRDIVKYLRDRQQVVSSVARSMLWMLAVGFGLRASFRPAAGIDYLSFLAPGLAAMSVLFGSMFAAISLVWDREFGFLKELLVAPVHRSAIVIAKMAAAATTSVAEAAIVLLLAPLLGARYNAAGAALGLLLLGALGMGVNALGIIVASKMRSFEGFGTIVTFVVQPLFFLSGALYPIDGLPAGLKIAVTLNPMTYAVDGMRGLALGVHSFPLSVDAAVLVATTFVFGAAASWTFSRMQA
jgi:ABC-2 type transport system permease protein